MLDPGINLLDSNEKLPYIYKQNSSNIPFKRERNLNCLIKEKETVNKSAQESRRIQQISLINNQAIIRQQEQRPAVCDSKRREPLNIHKSFSFKCGSKRDKSKPDYKFLKWKEPMPTTKKEISLGSFFQS